MKTRVVLLLAAGFFAGYALHSPERPLSMSAAENLIFKASSGKANAVSLFMGPRPFTGVVAKDAITGERMILWVTNDMVVMGALFNKEGRNLTAQAVMDNGLLNAPEAAVSQGGVRQKDLIEMLASAKRVFTLGTSGPEIWAFVDPNCSVCRTFWDAVIGQTRKGKLKVHVIMVGVIKPDSEKLAATIVSDPNPPAMLERNEDGFTLYPEHGGLKPDENVPFQAVQDIQSNNRLLLAVGGRLATPTLVVPVGGNLQVFSGMPPNFPSLLP